MPYYFALPEEEEADLRGPISGPRLGEDQGDHP